MKPWPAIETEFTKLLDCKYPIIGAPMFLVSNVEMVTKITNYGALGTFPALNYRPISEYERALKEMNSRTEGPFGVNIIVNKSNTRQGDDLRLALDNGARLFITSLGNPKDVIADAHKSGAKVFCDVTNVEHAKKVQDLGADGVIAVASGAGGHAGPISPFVLVPWLKRELDIPIAVAGGIANGQTVAASLALGAAAVSIGTRFIACTEAGVDQNYKQAIVDSTPEDIVMTTRVSGTPAAVINTDYVKKMGTDLPYLVKLLKSNPMTKKYVVPLIHLAGMKALEKAADKPTWKTVWSAGQSVGLVHEIASCEQILNDILQDYFDSLDSMVKMSPEKD